MLHLAFNILSNRTSAVTLITPGFWSQENHCYFIIPRQEFESSHLNTTGTGIPRQEHVSYFRTILGSASYHNHLT